MATDILRKGKYAITSEWQTLAAGDVHTVIVTGEYGAGLLIEAKVGAGDDDAQEIGSVSASGQAMKQLVGPLTYRVRRHKSIVDTGCSVDGDGAVTQPADPTPPANTVAPAITGNAIVGQTLTASAGEWSGSEPVAYQYQWLRSGNPIPYATAGAYVVTEDDIGHALSCRVAATNTMGGALVVTAETASVTKAPVNTALPTITGTPTAGQTLTSTTGTWSGAPTPTYTRRWLRNGSAIASATAETYELVEADVGAKITVEVTATNTAGNAVAVSAETETIAGVAPVNEELPEVTGTAVIGEELSVSDGTWLGIPEPVYTYQWQSSADGEEWTNIAGATAATYTIAAEMDGLQIRAVVTGTNSTSAVAANAAGVGPVAAE